VEITLEPPYLIIKPDLTEEDFYRLADEDADWEYLDGRIVMHSPASHRHEQLQSFLLTLLRAYVRDRSLGDVVGSRYPMRLDPKWSPEPDILFVRQDRRGLMASQRLEGPADLVIEIASDSDPGLDHREKLPRYREAGIEEIWLIDPFQKNLRVEVRTGTDYAARIVSTGWIESVAVRGFRIDVSWLWQQELPSELACLRQIM
jgi:Uma2 family endonuclease